MKPLLDYRPALVNGQGIGRYVRELARGLASGPGVDLALFAPTWAPASFELDTLGVEEARVFRRRLPSKAVTRLLAGFGFGVERLFQGGADVCHHTQYRRLPTKLPEVAMIHDLVFLDTDRFMGSETAGRMSTFARRAARECRAITTPSEAVADEVAERLDVPRERVFATPLGVDHVWRTEDGGGAVPMEGVSYLFTAARIETRKNLGAVLRAFERLEVPGLRWKVAGVRGSGAEDFEAALAKSPARGSVDLLGHVSEAELRRLVRGALAFVLVPFDEGFGLAPLEAMALGTPAITSDVPVVKEVCGGGAVLVDPHDDRGLADAIGELAGSSASRERQSEAGRAHAAQFTWERTAARTMEAYRHAMGG